MKASQVVEKYPIRPVRAEHHMNANTITPELFLGISSSTSLSSR
jgi:hypothetical protein